MIIYDFMIVGYTIDSTSITISQANSNLYDTFLARAARVQKRLVNNLINIKNSLISNIKYRVSRLNISK